MKTASNKLAYIRRGFTLIELVVVVLILGILAAVALPKFIGQSDNAKLNGTLQTLTVLRTAIDTYRVNNPGYPAAANLNAVGPTGIMQYLRTTTFPSVQVGASANQNNQIDTTTNSPPTATGTTKGWVYNATSGEIAINDATVVNGTALSSY